MLVPLVLVLVSLAAFLAAFVVPGAQDLVLLAGPSTAASLWLLLCAALRPAPPQTQPSTTAPLQAQAPAYAAHQARSEPASGSPFSAPKWVVIDGSNVMHWKDNTPRIETVREVVDHLSDLGFTPGVVFDANAGYLLSGKYQHDGSLGRQLGLAEDRVMVVPKGTPADPAILNAARSLGARVVSNDRYRDWTDQHPEVKSPHHLIRGDYETGALRLNLN